MEVAYVVCPECDLRFCVGVEYTRRPSMVCMCPRCEHEFTYGSRQPPAGEEAPAEVSPWV